VGLQHSMPTCTYLSVPKKLYTYAMPKTLINITEYTDMLHELATMRGDVLGFTDVNNTVRLRLEHDLEIYRDSLRKQGRKDRLIIDVKNKTLSIDPRAAQDVLQVNESNGYDFTDVFDIAICDDTVFISKLHRSHITVRRFTDAMTFHAYTSFFTDLWATAAKRDSLNITTDELRALLTPYNVASAHNLHALSNQQQAIIETLPALWRSTHHTQQKEIEQAFLSTFFKMRHCPRALRTGKNYINYSASAFTAIIANYLRSSNTRTSLISPCVDLIPDLLRDGGVMPTALKEGIFHDATTLYEKLVHAVHTDAVYLVNPNNPTGFCLDEQGELPFRELARFCHDHHKLLIIDMCFMPFVSLDRALTHIDCYQIFDKADIDYIIIEDSGKFLPTMDLKASILHVSSRLVPRFDQLHSSFILRASPFALKTITAFLEEAMTTNMAPTYTLIHKNLCYMRNAFRDLPLVVEQRPAKFSLAWIRITDEHLTAADLRQAAQQVQIDILTGNTFYWDDPAKGDRYIRIALARDQIAFQRTIDLLGGQLAALVRK